MKRTNLEKSFESCPVMEVNGFLYFVHPLCDGCVPIEPGLLEEVASEMIEHINLKSKEINKIVCIESMGIPLGVAVAQKMNLPLVIVRKRDYAYCNLNQLEIEQRKEYEKNSLFINSIYPKDKVFIIDDVIASGNTIKSVSEGIQQIGAEIIGIGVVAEIGKGKDREFSEIFNCKVFSLINVKFEKTKLVVE